MPPAPGTGRPSLSLEIRSTRHLLSEKYRLAVERQHSKRLDGVGAAGVPAFCRSVDISFIVKQIDDWWFMIIMVMVVVTVKLLEMSAVKLRVVSEGQLSNHKTLCDDRFHAATSSV